MSACIHLHPHTPTQSIFVTSLLPLLLNQTMFQCIFCVVAGTPMCGFDQILDSVSSYLCSCMCIYPLVSICTRIHPPQVIFAPYLPPPQLVHDITWILLITRTGKTHIRTHTQFPVPCLTVKAPKHTPKHPTYPSTSISYHRLVHIHHIKKCTNWWFLNKIIIINNWVFLDVVLNIRFLTYRGSS